VIGTISFEQLRKDILQIYETDPKVLTLDQKKPNWLVDADDAGLHVRTLRSGDIARSDP